MPSQLGITEKPEKIAEDNDPDCDPEYKASFQRKYDLLKTLLMRYVFEKVPVLKLEKEIAKRILVYAQDSFFKHLRLYEFVFNNTTANEMKRINFTVETVKTAKPL